MTGHLRTTFLNTVENMFDETWKCRPVQNDPDWAFAIDLVDDDPEYDGTAIALVKHDNEAVNERQRANRMAAANELVEACESVVDYIDDSFDNDIEGDYDEVRRAMGILRRRCREALNKANADEDATPSPPPIPQETRQRNAYAQGVTDGLTQEPFTSGVTWQDPTLNEFYDQGVNMGQQIRANQDEPVLNLKEPLRAAPVQRVVISQLQTESDVEGEYKGIYMAQVRKIENVFMPSLRGSGSAWLDPIESPTPCVMINGRWHQAFHREKPNDMMSSYWEVIVQREDPLPAPLQEQPCELTDTQELVMAARKLLFVLQEHQHTFVGDIPKVFMEKLHKALPPAPTGEE